MPKPKNEVKLKTSVKKEVKKVILTSLSELEEIQKPEVKEVKIETSKEVKKEASEVKVETSEEVKKEVPETEVKIETSEISKTEPKPVSVAKNVPLFSRDAEVFYNMKECGVSMKDILPPWMMQKAKAFLHRTIEIFDVQKWYTNDEKAPKRFCFVCGEEVKAKIVPVIDNDGRVLKQEIDEHGKIWTNKKGSFVKRLINDNNDNLVAVPSIACGSPYKYGSHAWEIRNIKYYENEDRKKPVYFTGKDGKVKPLRLMMYEECEQSCEETNKQFAKRRYDDERHAKDYNKTFAAPTSQRKSSNYQKDPKGPGYTKDGIWSNHPASHKS